MVEFLVCHSVQPSLCVWSLIQWCMEGQAYPGIARASLHTLSHDFDFTKHGSSAMHGMNMKSCQGPRARTKQPTSQSNLLSFLPKSSFMLASKCRLMRHLCEFCTGYLYFCRCHWLLITACANAEYMMVLCHVPHCILHQK